MNSTGRAIIAIGLLLVTTFVLAQGPNRDLGNNVPITPAPPSSQSGPPGAGAITLDVNLVNLDVVVIGRCCGKP